MMKDRKELWLGWVLELAGKLRLLYIAFVVNSIILHYIIFCDFVVVFLTVSKSLEGGSL